VVFVPFTSCYTIYLLSIVHTFGFSQDSPPIPLGNLFDFQIFHWHASNHKHPFTAVNLVTHPLTFGDNLAEIRCGNFHKNNSKYQDGKPAHWEQSWADPGSIRALTHRVARIITRYVLLDWLSISKWENSEDVSFPGFDHCFDAVARIQLGQDVFNMLFNGVYTDIELGTNLLIVQIV